MNGLRQRHTALQAVRELDAFPKVSEDYKETTATGGGVSILVFILIAILMISEIHYYSETELKFDYMVDTDPDSKLEMNIDMTVAMKCKSIGADVLDVTGSTAGTFGRLKEERVHFDLTKSQQNYLKMIHQINDYIKNEYHAIHHFLWKTGYTGQASELPPRGKDEVPEGEPNGCRVHGTLTLNKVAGNFHITAGKSVGLLGGGHAHLSMDFNDNYNFSHRIDHFSFGKKAAGVVHPLDGDLKIAEDNYHIYQYFVQVVPTKVQTYAANVDTYQYAVTERDRTISHAKGSHGVPGIFIKYDLSSLKVLVVEKHKPYWQFLVRLCGIVGGVFATSGMLHSFVGFIIDVVYCRYSISGISASINQPSSLSSPHNTVQAASLLTPHTSPAQNQQQPSPSLLLDSSPLLPQQTFEPSILPTQDIPL